MKNYLNQKTLSCDSLVRNTSVYCITLQGWDVPNAVKLLMSMTMQVLQTGQRSASAFSLLTLRGRHTALPVTKLLCARPGSRPHSWLVYSDTKAISPLGKAGEAAIWDSNKLGGTVSGVFHAGVQDVRGMQGEPFSRQATIRLKSQFNYMETVGWTVNLTTSKQ